MSKANDLPTSENIRKTYELWLESPCFDEATKSELYSIKDDWPEIEDRFFKELQFGTAGLRGVIGAGTNRMNVYTVRKATQGLADCISCEGEAAKARGVVITYDSRRMSREFSEAAALVLAANGIKTYLFKDLRATPELSFAIRYLNCMAGIVVTASHNPKEYNGYKVYWEDGAQIATERAESIIASIAKINDFAAIPVLSKEEALTKGLLVYLDEQVDDQYITAVKKQSIRSDIINKVAGDFKVVYTPLHGTGNRPVRRVLKEIGFKNVYVVPEQELPDSEFSTVRYPNPEDKKAFQLSIELAKGKEAQLVLATDPDCDRVGAVVKNDSGEYVVLTGNQTGALLVDYILKQRKEAEHLPDNGAIIKTIVTSEMGADIAKGYGVEVMNTLTGFKYIGEKIKQFEAAGDKTFLFGYEESYGYLAGTYARDKDAVVTSMLICEMAAYYYDQGMNLYQALMALYDKYGYYLEDLKSITLAGKEGLEKIGWIMECFRGNPPAVIGDSKVIVVEDYARQQNRTLPKANVLKFILEDDGWVCLRPSGTEPKLKIYAGVKGNTLQESRERLAQTIAWMVHQIKEN